MAAMSFIGPEGRRQLQVAARFASAGLELVISIVVGYFGGRALDRWLGSGPYCSYAGLGLGIVAGFYNLFALARSTAALLPAQPSAQSDDETAGSKKDTPSQEP